MSNGILVFAEHRAGAFNKTSFEAVAAAQSLGAELQQPVMAVVLGAGMSDLAQEVAAYDVSRVIYADHEKLAEYTPRLIVHACGPCVPLHDVICGEGTVTLRMPPVATLSWKK